MTHPDDAPPPPYSETDMYSTSTPSAFRPSPADQNTDDASVTASSSHSNIIYTPPETPDAQDDGAAAGGTDASPLPASAQAYFAARPAAGRPPSAHIVHAIHFAEGMTPAHLPYPGWAAERQVAEQDWHDFVNHLVPPHAENADEYMADRKLRAEREAGTPSKAGRTFARAQLDPAGSPADASRREQSYDVALRTVHDWNEGFFAPRGVTLRLDPVLGFPDMLQAWNQTALDDSRELPHQSDCSGPTGWPSGAWNRGRGRGWPRVRGMFSGAIQEGRGAQGEPGPHGHHGAEHGYRGHGRGCGEYVEGPHRPHSRSSASSDSSSSSSGSDSSVGSLPDWDELSEAQLPIVRRSVGNWVHSGQPVPKAEYKRVKAEIKAAEGSPGDSAGQRKEIKKLLAQWKDIQKSQKTAMKAAKKAAKKEKISRKWEGKAERKASKKNKKHHRHSERDARRDAPAAGSHAHGAFGPAPPGAPPSTQPGTFGSAPGPAGPWPSGPGAFGGFGPGRRGGPGPFGFFGGGRGGWARGLFGGHGPDPPGAWQPGAAAASEQAAAAVRHAHAVRDAALHDARRQRAEATAQAHAARDDALRDAASSRQRAQETAAAAVRHAHAVRDAALHDARRQRAEATAQAHAARDAALRDAAASRQGAQAAADRARDEARRHQAAWQPWGWGPSATASSSAGPSSQAPYNPGDGDRTGSDEERPSADSNLQTQYAQREKRAVPAAQAGPEDANVPDSARQDRATEIHELESRLLALRMEADEALARQLAEEEARGGRPS